MNHKKDKFIASYWVGNREVSVSIVWKGWDYKTGNEYCKREDYTQGNERWTHIFYDKPVLEKDYEDLYWDIYDECARRNCD